AVAGACVADAGAWHHHHAVARQAGALADVTAVLERSQGGVRTTEFVPDRGVDEHAGSSDGQYVVGSVVLALVDLGVFDPGEPPAPSGGAHPHGDEPVRIVPFDLFGPGDGDRV